MHWKNTRQAKYPNLANLQNKYVSTNIQILKKKKTENKYFSFQIELLLFTRDQIRENSFFQIDLRQAFSVTMIGPYHQIIEHIFNEILVLFVRLHSKTLAPFESNTIHTLRENNILTNVKTFWVYVRLSLFIITIGPHC